MNGELSVWQNMVWGRQLLQVHGLPGWMELRAQLPRRAALQSPPAATAFGWWPFCREAGTSIVLGKKRAARVLAVSCRHRGGQAEDRAGGADGFDAQRIPLPGASQTYPLYLRAFLRWSQMLDHRDLDFRHVPEGAILAATELEGFRVIILPYATYFPEGLADRLLAWVKAGGLLIAEGVPGVYTAHCFEQPDLMRAVFGDEVKWAYAGDRGRGVNWRWELKVAGNAERTKTVVARDKAPLLVAGTYGKGSVLVARNRSASFGTRMTGRCSAKGAFCSTTTSAIGMSAIRRSRGCPPLSTARSTTRSANRPR